MAEKTATKSKPKSEAKSGARKEGGEKDKEFAVDMSDSKPGDTLEDKMDKVQHGAEPEEHEGADADLAEASIKDLTGVATKTVPQAHVAKAAAQFAQFGFIEGLEGEDGEPLKVVDFSYDSDGYMVAVTETRTRWRSSPGSGEWTNETTAKAERRVEENEQRAKDFEEQEKRSAAARDQSLAQTRKEGAKNTS